MAIDYVEITGVYSKIQELYKKTTLDSIIYRLSTSRRGPRLRLSIPLEQRLPLVPHILHQ